MKLAALLQKVRTLNPQAISAWDILEMATRNGAYAIGKLKTLGSLEPGKKADLVVVSLKHPSLHPISNPLSLLVYAATGSNVRDVMVDGRFVVRMKNASHLTRTGTENANRHLERVLNKLDKPVNLLTTI
jgi:5-methylthioadenosine/S-adenosylhomocysteine deaminase